LLQKVERRGEEAVCVRVGDFIPSPPLARGSSFTLWGGYAWSNACYHTIRPLQASNDTPLHHKEARCNTSKDQATHTHAREHDTHALKAF